MEEITYDYLRRAQAKEKGSPQLAELSEEFYPSIQVALEGWEKRTRESFSLADAKEYENILKILRDIYSRREQKIVLAALRSAKGGEKPAALVGDEQEFFESVSRAIGENGSRFESLINKRERGGKESKSAEKAEREIRDTKMIKLLSDLPSFVGLDMSTYGPFKRGEMHTLPKREAELLLSRRVAEAV